MDLASSDIDSTSVVSNSSMAPPQDSKNDESIESNDGTSESQAPPPKYEIKQSIWAKDTSTPLLYEAYVRKKIYAPKSKQVDICSVNIANESSSKSGYDDLKSALDSMVQDSEMVETWHYFVHYKGWKNNWDRW
jgi:hypothetical protein